jgi:hypothetical protein
VLHQILEQGELSAGVIITFQVMAFAWMSPGYPDSVCALAQRREKELGAHPSRTGNPDDPNVGRILHPADAGQIRGTIAAPITQKGDDFWFPIGHDNSISVKDL